MAIPGSINELLLGAAASSGGGFQIEQSLQFNHGESQSLKLVYGSGGSATTWSLSFWIKRCFNSTVDQTFLLNQNSPTSFLKFKDSTNSKIELAFTPSIVLTTTDVYRDFSSWMHVLVVYDSTNATNTDRARLYVNGERVVDFDSPTYPGPSASSNLNLANYYTIGHYNSTNGLDAYLAEFHFVDGQALNTSNFGKFDDRGVWQPISYTGSYGTTGYYLNFSSSSPASALGTDSSPNGNDWTANNFTGSTVSNFNLDVTSTPFTDIGQGISITNNNAVTTTTAAANSFNLTTVGSFNGSNQWLSTPSFAMGQAYTFDYYFYAETTQLSNATVIDIGSENVIRDYGSATSRNVRLKDASGSVDYPYTVSAQTWNHVRITQAGIWVNGSSIASNPVNVATRAGVINVGTYNNSTLYIFNGQIGPVRIAFEDLGAPPAGGLVANADGTLTNVASSDPDRNVLSDSPTNGVQIDTGVGGEVNSNYCILNRAGSSGSFGLRHGNLNAYVSSTGHSVNHGTFGMSSGKWYWEFSRGEFSANCGAYGIHGLKSASRTYAGWPSPGTNSDQKSFYMNASNNTIIYQGPLTPGGYSIGSASTPPLPTGWNISAGTWMFAVDMDNYKAWVGKNGVWWGYTGSAYTTTGGDPANNINGLWTLDANDTYFPYIGPYSAAGNDFTIETNFGQRRFNFTPPSGFKALCNINLPDPTIADGSAYFDTKLYNGTGAEQTISGFSFSPDLVWLKRRATTNADNTLFDTVRGAGKELVTNTSSTEFDAGTGSSGSLIAFNTDGFNLGTRSSVNGSSTTNVAWAWDAGNSTVTDTNGTITSQVRANPSVGFSVVTYTGISGASKTIGHGLNAEPELIIAKARTTASPSDWTVGCKHLSGGWNEYGFITTASWSASSGIWNDGASNDTNVFSVANYPTNAGNGIDYVAYCFASVKGFSQVGVYVGNGTTSGPFINCGFQPKFLMIKNTDALANWVIYDTVRDTNNPAENKLFPNSNLIEGVLSGIDIVSNGFKPIAANGTFNGSGFEHIYLAMAESPFKYTRAR